MLSPLRVSPEPSQEGHRAPSRLRRRRPPYMTAGVRKRCKLVAVESGVCSGSGVRGQRLGAALGLEG
ncbi:hypothetical protein J1N35_011008 [Gossypium stocksii]|uniref:Uncharacterized protein n=1 Tax=Gossypium stocksii TaxID=47602 RepID=A0A9D3W381_9ROSI|nr:hypothetical protein J1N35_011008 [Gossypium stocksii]